MGEPEQVERLRLPGGSGLGSQEVKTPSFFIYMETWRLDPLGCWRLFRRERGRAPRDDIATHVCGSRGVQPPQVVPYGGLR